MDELLVMFTMGRGASLTLLLVMFLLSALESPFSGSSAAQRMCLLSWPSSGDAGWTIGDCGLDNILLEERKMTSDTDIVGIPKITHLIGPKLRETVKIIASTTIEFFFVTYPTVFLLLPPFKCTSCTLCPHRLQRLFRSCVLS